MFSPKDERTLPYSNFEIIGLSNNFANNCFLKTASETIAVPV